MSEPRIWTVDVVFEALDEPAAKFVRQQIIDLLNDHMYVTTVVTQLAERMPLVVLGEEEEIQE